MTNSPFLRLRRQLQQPSVQKGTRHLLINWRGIKCILFAAAWLAFAGGISAQTVTLTGVSNNQVLTNGQKVTLTAAVTGASGDHQTLAIYDGTKFIFGRPFSSASVGADYSFMFEWFDPPLGQHALQARRVEINPVNGSPIRTNLSAVINISVVGRTFGFASISNMFTSPSPEQPRVDTTFGCRLEVRNQTGAASNPLRVRLLTTQTYYYVTNEFQPPPATNTISFVETTNSTAFGSGLVVGTNASIFISIPSNNICPAAFDGGQFGEAQVQSHVYALLEEQLAYSLTTNWSIVDSARLIFSILEPSSQSWNYGAKGINPPRSENRIARPVSLVIAGPTNIVGGTTVPYLGLAGFSDKNTGAVNCAWTSNSPLLSINSNGQATASITTTTATVGVTATYNRPQPALTTSKSVSITAPPSVTLTGVTNNQTLINGQQIRLTTGATGIERREGLEYFLSLYDGTKFLFGRAFNGTNVPVMMVFDWPDAPLGTHLLQAELVQVDTDSGTRVATNRSALNTFQVVGRTFGFASISNLFINPSPQQPFSDTIFGCRLEVRNQTDATSNPLRVRLLTTQTYYYVTNEFAPPPSTVAFNEVTNSTALASNFTVGTNMSFFVSVPSNQICPQYFRADDQAYVQSHVYAILEERIGNNWSIVDSAQIIFSILPTLFPYNDGAIAMNPLTSTNRVAYPTNMIINGPTNLTAGSTTSYVAVATLSDSASGTVIPKWSSSSSLLTINSNGLATAGSTTSNATVSVIASYTRSYVTTMTTQRVTIVEAAVAPSITSPLQNQVVAFGSNATFSVVASGSAPLSYQWRFNTTPISGATTTSYTVTNAQAGSAGSYIVTVTNRAGSISSTGMLSVASRPMLSARYLQNNNSVELTLTTTPGHNCIIDVSTNLITWTNYITLPNPASQTILTESASSAPRRFYRARVTN